MKKIKFLAIICAFVLIVGCFSGCKSNNNEYTAKISGNSTTHKWNGYTITLPNEYIKNEDDRGVFFQPEDEDVVVDILFEDWDAVVYSSLTEDSTIEDYMKTVFREDQQFNIIEEKSGKQKFMYCAYERDAEGSNLFYVTVVHKGSGGFWAATFGTNASNRATYEPLFLEWAKTISAK